MAASLCCNLLQHHLETDVAVWLEAQILEKIRGGLGCGLSVIFSLAFSASSAALATHWNWKCVLVLSFWGRVFRKWWL